MYSDRSMYFRPSALDPCGYNCDGSNNSVVDDCASAKLVAWEEEHYACPTEALKEELCAKYRGECLVKPVENQYMTALAVFGILIVGGVILGTTVARKK